MIDNQNEMLKALRSRTKKLEREGDYWNKEEIERLKELFYSGVGISEIALTLQRTEPAVQQQIEKLDLYDRGQNPQRRKKEKKKSCSTDNCPYTPETCPKLKDHEQGGEECSENTKNC